MRSRWVEGALGIAAVLSAAGAIGWAWAVDWPFTDALDGLKVRIAAED